MELARAVLETYVKTGSLPDFHVEDPALLKEAGCFVTLRKKGALRGCVGTVTSEQPLADQVARMTAAAASNDFRFVPVQAEELKEIEIEISVLSPLEPIHSWEEIELGRHGICVEGGNRTGVFLPEVAEEMNWTAEEFVRACRMQKAGIPESAWPETKLCRFTTEKIWETE